MVSRSRKLNNEHVLDMRKNYNPNNRNWSMTGIAKRYRVSLHCVRSALLGITYSDLPGALEFLGQQPTKDAA